MENSKNWNDGSSYDVDRMTVDELKVAFHDWSCGCKELEELLWTSYNHGLKSTYSGQENIGYLFREENREVLKQLCNYAQGCPWARVRLVFQSNPYSGPNWYKPWIHFGEDVRYSNKRYANRLFRDFTKIINGELVIEPQEGYAILLDYYDFFKDKIPELDVRVDLKEWNYNLSFIIDARKRNVDDYLAIFLDNIFEKSFTLERKERDRDVILSFKSETFTDFIQTSKDCLEALKKGWKREIPDEPWTDMLNCNKALVMQHHFGTSREGIAKMNELLNQNRPDIDFPFVNY